MFDDLINEIDLNIELFLDKYIEIPCAGKLYCLTNNEIKKIKYTKYNQYLAWLCIDQDNIKKMLTKVDNATENISTFQFLMSGCLYDKHFRQIILNALSVFFKEEIIFSEESLYFFVGQSEERKIIYDNNYELIKYVLKKQNGLKTEEKTEKFANSIAQQMAEKLKQMREKYNKTNNDEENIYDYSDIISSVSAKHPSINPLNIGELTVYQTMNQFQRLNKIDKFEIDIQSLLHGAKSDDIKLDNWFSKIKII